MLNFLLQSTHPHLSHDVYINLHLIHHQNHIVQDHIPPMPITPELSFFLQGLHSLIYSVNYVN